jgi:hypothetical protein
MGRNPDLGSDRARRFRWVPWVLLALVLSGLAILIGDPARVGLAQMTLVALAVASLVVAAIDRARTRHMTAPEPSETTYAPAIDPVAIAERDRAEIARLRRGLAAMQTELAAGRAAAEFEADSALASLEERVKVAEARALDAERRLQELTEQVEAAAARRAGRSTTLPRPPDPQAEELRARLARTAARKKPGGVADDD